jgi:CheY-like chemotaxis protein
MSGLNQPVLMKHLILYAEDDMDDFMMIRKSFELHDHIEFIHAVNGQEALIELNQICQENQKPDLILLDVEMPVMNGRETFEKIKRHPDYKNIPVVLISKNVNPLDRVYAFQNGCEIIAKPVHATDQEQFVLKFLDKLKNLQRNKN